MWDFLLPLALRGCLENPSPDKSSTAKWALDRLPLFQTQLDVVQVSSPILLLIYFQSQVGTTANSEIAPIYESNYEKLLNEFTNTFG